MKFQRASSTSIRTFMDCARKGAFAYSKGFEVGDGLVTPIRVEVSEAMATGTVTHAVLELRFAGEEATEEAVRAMEGNYEDPHEALDAFSDSDLFSVALETADTVGEDVRGWLEDYFGAEIVSAEIEFDLEDHEVFFEAGPAAGGYIDLLLELSDGRLVVWDWKTRSRLDYIPRTEAEFRADPQLCYYAAALLQARPDLAEYDSIVVGHGNLLRADCSGGPKAVPVHAEIPTWYLQGVWTHLEGVAAEMVEAMGKHPTESPRNRGACYKYGPCPHLEYCQTGGQEFTSAFDWAKSTNIDHLIEEDA